MAELDTVLVGGIAQVDGGLQDVGGLDAGDADQELIAQAMKEQVIAETRLVGIPQVAEAIGVGVARHAHDQRGGAAGLIVRIGITPVAKHQVQAVDGVDVARMGAEDHARDHFLLEIGHLVGGGVVTHERFGGRKEVALRRCERGVVGQVHLIRRADGLERIVRTALHGGHDLVAVHECRHQCG